MKSILFRTCFCFFLLLFAAPLAAQLTPVRIDVRLFQPSVYPEDLAAPGAAVVSVTLTDMDRASLPGYLRLTLSNNSGQEVTTPLVAETLITLTPFNTVTLTGPALERFVRLLGADAGAMNGNGTVFAEGEIVLCAEFYDLDFPFEAPINNADNCSFGFAELHEPPTPFFPVDEEVVAIDPLQDAVNFTWAPNYFGGPVINYLTVWDVPREWTNVTPDIIMSSLEPISQPVRVNELNALNKVWYNSDADLIPGHRYLYQIQATDPTGRARFRNNGYSRPEFFDYVSPTPFTDRLCYEPERLTLDGKDGNYKLFWTGYPIDSVNHTVTVVTLPERGFVQLSELLTTPTFPGRSRINGGPTARFNYELSTDLDTTNGRAYLITLCTVCPLNGEELCVDVIFGEPRETGLNDGTEPTDDECLTSLNFTRPDSTDTTLDLAWSYDPNAVSITDSFTLIWQTADGGEPELTATVAYLDETFTITDRIPGQTYTLRVCAECTISQLACRDLPPFGGCVAEYLPELVDLADKRALLGWPVNESPALPTQARYAMRSFLNWTDLPTGTFSYFNPDGHPFPGEQLAETPRLSTSLVYLGQVRTQCQDTPSGPPGPNPLNSAPAVPSLIPSKPLPSPTSASRSWPLSAPMLPTISTITGCARKRKPNGR